MPRALILILALLLFGINSFGKEQNPPVVEITFKDPASFTDIRSTHGANEKDYSWVLLELSKHLQKLVATYLPEGAHLTVIITDIDLAGHLEFWHTSEDLRVVRDVYPPLIRLEFKLLTSDGVVKAEGSRRLRNRNFLQQLSGNSTDPLRYEKELLKKWFKKDLR